MFTVGRLGRPNGLKGFLGLYVEPDDLIYFEPGSSVIIDGRSFVVRALRQGSRGPQIALEGVLDRDGAEAIRNLEVFGDERRQLGEREFWPEDLVGLAVRPGGGEVIGVEHGPGQDRLVVRRADRSFEVPFVDELVPVVNLDEGYVEIVEIEGLTEPSDRR